MSDEQLLSFLGELANVPGGAVTEPVFLGAPWIEEGMLQVAAEVMTERSYRLQGASTPAGGWSTLESMISTNTVIHVWSTLDVEDGVRQGAMSSSSMR